MTASGGWTFESGNNPSPDAADTGDGVPPSIAGLPSLLRINQNPVVDQESDVVF